MQNRIIIGLCGNSGSGKSTISRYLAQKGALIIDADKIAHELMQKGGKTYTEIIKHFGEDILGKDGEIDRKKLGELVFNNKSSLERLNGITHGIITEEIKSRISGAFVVIDAPLLTETGLDKICTQVWVVYADEKTRLERIMKRDGISEEAVLRRFANQTPFSVLSEYADFVIDNTHEPNLKKINYQLETMGLIEYN